MLYQAISRITEQAQLALTDHLLNSSDLERG